MFVSWIEKILQYRSQRFPLPVFMPVALTLTAASVAGVRPDGTLQVLISFITSALLIFQFRLWDDLADRTGDRIRHPDRVVCGPVRVSSFYLLVALIGLANSLALLFLGRLQGFLLICGLALFWYAGSSENARRTIVGRHLLLLKYPVFVWLISPFRSRLPALIPAMAGVYLCFGIYELLHDRELRSHRRARALMVVEVCALGCVAAVIFRALGESL